MDELSNKDIEGKAMDKEKIPASFDREKVRNSAL